MDGISDEKLVEACGQGDRRAYAVLVERHYRSVFFLCLGFLGNASDAEDIAQDAMLKGFVDIAKLRDASVFGPWIVRIAKNMCVNFLRRAKLSKAVLEEKARHVKTAGVNFDRLQIAISRLPQESRVPLVMYYFCDESVQSIAQKLDISASGVYQKLREATGQLHTLLSESEDLQ